METSKNRAEDNKKTVKTAMLNTIANGVSLMVGMLVIPVIIRVLSPEDLGIASTFVSTRNTFVIIATCAVYSYIHRAMLEYKEKKEEYLKSIIIFCIMALAVVFGVSLPFKSMIQKLFSLDDFLFFWLFISSLVFALYSIGYYYCVFYNKSKIVFSITLLSGPVAQFLAVGLAVILPRKKYIGRVIGLDFAYLVVAFCVLIWFLFWMGKNRFHWKYVRQTLSFSVPIIPHLLSQMVLTQCDLIMITYFAGEGKTGVYSMGHTVGFLAFTVMSQIMAVWSPWVYRRLEEKDYGIIYDKSKLMILLGAYMSIGLMTVTTELIKLFLTDAYLPCIYIVPPLVVAMYFQFIYLFLYDLEYYHKRAKNIATASVVAAVLNLILNAIFIKKYGYIAACYTTVTSYFVLVLLNYVFCLPLKVRKVYSMIFLLVSVILVSVYAVLMMVLWEHIIIRYAMLILITVVLLLTQYKEGFALVKSMKGE